MHARTYLHGSSESPYLYGLEPDMIGHISFLASAHEKMLEDTPHIMAMKHLNPYYPPIIYPVGKPDCSQKIEGFS